MSCKSMLRQESLKKNMENKTWNMENMEIEVVYPFESLKQDYVELRENLARNSSLRRKDFDCMMQGVLLTQAEKGQAVKSLVNDYFNGQKQITQTVKEKLEEFKESLARGDLARLEESQLFIKEILSEQEDRKKEVTNKLKEFQKEQEVMSGKLRQLLAKGRDLRAKDFKIMLQELGSQKEARLARQEERKQEVHSLLVSAHKYKRGGK